MYALSTIFKNSFLAEKYFVSYIGASLVFSIISQDIVNSGVFILSSNFPCTREALGLDLEMQTTLRAAVRYNSCPSIESYSSDKAETYFYAFTFKLLGLPM